jgi:hypothetical protein
MKRRRTRGRKLLVATAGLATISYVACKKDPPVGNLPAPMPEPTEMPVGNLPAPMPEPTETAAPEPSTSASAAATIATPPEPPDEPERPVGNLPAPMPVPEKPAPKK